MRRSALGAALLAAALSGCSGQPVPAAAPTTAAVTIDASALDDLLLSNAEIDAVMGTAMTPLDPATEMRDNRNLLPNLNCLGVWQVNEAAIYGRRGPDSWQAVRQRMSRSPDSDQWHSVAVQSVVFYRTAEAAREFFDASAARWSECTEHRVNITLNDERLPTWRSGELTVTDNRLTMPIQRGAGADMRSCQHVLTVVASIVIDAQACAAQQTPATQAADIANKIESAITDRIEARG